MEDIKVNPNNIGVTFDINPSNLEKQTNLTIPSTPVRRSARLNHNMDSNNLNETDVDNDVFMKHDIELFKKFTEFQRFKKLYK